ncbi:hypothetical protein N9994_00940 [bacterium]|nr:hypothetical protein [bacterium]
MLGGIIGIVFILFILRAIFMFITGNGDVIQNQEKIIDILGKEEREKVKAKEEAIEFENRVIESRKTIRLKKYQEGLPKVAKDFYDDKKSKISNNLFNNNKLVEDKLLYLDHFIWSTLSSNSNVFEISAIKEIVDKGKWEEEIENLFDIEKNCTYFTYIENGWENVVSGIRFIDTDYNLGKNYVDIFAKEKHEYKYINEYFG